LTVLLTTALILLTPMSGVVSGGRVTSFRMISGLIPAIQWMYVSDIPAVTPGNFTEIVLQTGGEECFRVVSSGETAGINPLIASRVTKNGYAAQFLLEDISIYGISHGDSGSCAVSYKNATIDFRISSSESLSPAGEYSDNYILFAATENSSAIGVSFPFGESLSIGPAYAKGRSGGDFWLLSKSELGPFTLVSAPAIDEQNCYQRLYGTLECEGSEVLYGWDGTEWYDRFLFSNDNLLATFSLSVPGMMAGYSLDNKLLILLSHREEGWFQGEIQGKFMGVTAGVNFLRAPGDLVQWGFSAGVSLGNNPADNLIESLTSPWHSQMAASSLAN